MLQADINLLNMQLKGILDTLGETTRKFPPGVGNQGLSNISIGDSSAESVTDDMKRLVIFSEHCAEQTVSWRGATLQSEGVRLIIPQNAVKPGHAVTVGLQECQSKNFVVPEDFTLESPIFHISPEYHFQSKVSLVIEHYAYIERESDCTEFVFLSSPIKPSIQEWASTSQSLWEFHPCAKPKFSTDCLSVRVKLNHFCFTCLARKRKRSMMCNITLTSRLLIIWL